MTEELVIELLTDVFFTVFQILLPILSVALVVGIFISVFQAATSIQEMTLTFVPKIIFTGIAVILLIPWIVEKMIGITNRVIAMMNSVIQ
ncbi:MAG: flagellar type III secretion system protein FliQ [Melioribacteraceae bacterium]|nr:flagellar type III secretion system protein FliQ [Melioribacteraceae bacterium]